MRGISVSNSHSLRAVRESIENVLRDVTDTALPSRLTYSDNAPTAAGQYWEYELSVWREGSAISFGCGCFAGAGSMANRELGINSFFENNDKLLEEFGYAVESGAFDALIPILKQAESVAAVDTTRDQYSGVALTVNARVIAADEWLRSVCEECVMIVHLSETSDDRLDLGCQQSERYRIRVPAPSGHAYMRVPYDKVSCFPGSERMEQHSDAPYHEYEVALSFAGEDRRYVAQVAGHLRRRGIRVFYDEYEKVALWGKDLYVHLDEVYRKRSRYCVTFLSAAYRAKLWTSHERESAQARAFEQHSEYILPVKLDSTEIPGIRSTVGYIQKMPPRQLAELIVAKCYGSSS
jgi:hypothetical protein